MAETVVPQVNWSTLGNAAALRALERALAQGPAHAYLFAGPEGVGKGLAALELAAVVNCAADVRPCHECRSCRETFSGRHPDVEVLKPGSICDEAEHGEHTDSRDIRICQVRRLERVLSLAPYVGGWRVAIVEDAQTLNTQAANAFLKTLEEPPARTLLVLLTDAEESLPETILSRCQRVSFHRADMAAVEQALVEKGASEAEAERIAALAAGRIGWALRALADPGLVEERETFLAEALRLAHAGRIERFAWAAPASDRAPRLKERFLREIETWEGWWRDVLAVGAGAEAGLVNPGRKTLLLEESKLYSAPDVVDFLRALAQAKVHLSQNVDPQLALEVLTMRMPSPQARGAVQDR